MNAAHELASANLRLALCSVYRTLTDELSDKVEDWPLKIIPRISENSLAAREIQRQFASVIDRVADELEQIHASGDDIDQESYFGALAGITSVLDKHALTLVASRDLAEKSPSDLHRQFLPSIEQEWDHASIGEYVREYGRSSLTLCCYTLIAWTRIVPPDRSQAAWGTLVNSTRLIEQTRIKLIEMRRAAVTGTGATARIIGTQRRDLSSALGQIELFGLPFERRFRRVPLSVSYLPPYLTSQRGEARAKGVPLTKLIDSLSKNASIGRSDTQGIRLIISGRAGSGKTTAVQWMAFNASQQGLQSLTNRNRPLLPLFVRMRDVVTSRTPPSDRALLYSIQLREEVSPRWLEESRKTVTPLILLDGWDELSPENKAGAEQWVSSLATRFQDAHIIVTSRPEGIDGEVFEELKFRTVTVLPLHPDQSSELAKLWFKGLIEQLYASPDIDISSIQKARRNLLRELSTPTISDMADSPLLTCMLCCLYATGNTTAPDKRGKLYDLVVSALLDARERERDTRISIWKNLDVDKKKKLVGAIARAMSEEGVFTLPVRTASNSTLPTVFDIVSDTLPLIGRSRSEAEATLWVNTILDRSIVLQRVSDTEAEFVHRNIQDYLVAVMK